MSIIFGLLIAVVCVGGGFSAMGGHLTVIWQPFEFIIVGGAALGAYVVANSTKVVLGTGNAIMDAALGRVPKEEDYLQLLGLLFALTRELRSKPRNEVETHLEDPDNSPIFKAYPRVTRDPELQLFICDYVRLILIGNARSYEIEALMEEEIAIHRNDKLKVYGALMGMADGLPALGIVAAILGIVKAMGALDQSPALLGSLIGSALVGTFTGIFVSYGLVGPMANKIKVVRETQARVYVIVKQTLLAYMNGALPQIAVEHGRKAITAAYRPTIDDVERATITGPQRGGEAVREAA
ncbi:flagellar motor stator protein MotA [Methylobacterium sp. J-070]|uniref:flagellar motor stator protein MotA n=1 Tax=Methylobacterium sp. J-070 TaxID=2836650 RepID=UPI001FBB20E1|nr:flagellar motor stator protein MotA [Methylobacterium sp. J-070]MCJ2048338.1 flagellar motor stator protein MotA [Methylobacterium sp. J-070]